VRKRFFIFWFGFRKNSDLVQNEFGSVRKNVVLFKVSLVWFGLKKNVVQFG